MFPENIVQATFQQVEVRYTIYFCLKVQTYYIPRPPRVMRINDTWTNATDLPQKPHLEYTNEMNVLGWLNIITLRIFIGLIVFCSGFGVILSILGDQARLMINFFIVLDAIIMRWISALMW